MADLAERGFTGVLHTFSENDLAYYREQMARIVAVSHDHGLEVQVNPWGVGHTFGGEAFSLFTAAHPEVGQVFEDGRRIGAACPNQPAFRAHLRDWADAALELGADRIFWDEPHWAHAATFGVGEEHWTCRCDACQEGYRERHGEPMPTALTEDLLAFREASMVGFVEELVAHVGGRGGRSTVCLLPLTEGSHGIRDWDAVAGIDGLDTFATDPYWRAFGEDAAPFVRRFADLLVDLAGRHDVTPQLWIQGFGLGPEDTDDIRAAVRIAREAGIEDLWTWGYDACGHMPSLGTRSPEAVWEVLSAAMTDGSDRARAAS